MPKIKYHTENGESYTECVRIEGKIMVGSKDCWACKFNLGGDKEKKIVHCAKRFKLEK
jgi:hypothetical protein